MQFYKLIDSLSWSCIRYCLSSPERSDRPDCPCLSLHWWEPRISFQTLGPSTPAQWGPTQGWFPALHSPNLVGCVPYWNAFLASPHACLCPRWGVKCLRWKLSRKQFWIWKDKCTDRRKTGKKWEKNRKKLKSQVLPLL